jgi:hypothetical protein
MSLQTATTIMLIALYFVFGVLVTIATVFELLQIKTGRALLLAGLMVLGYLLASIN